MIKVAQVVGRLASTIERLGVGSCHPTLINAFISTNIAIQSILDGQLVPSKMQLCGGAVAGHSPNKLSMRGGVGRMVDCILVTVRVKGLGLGPLLPPDILVSKLLEFSSSIELLNIRNWLCLPGPWNARVLSRQKHKVRWVVDPHKQPAVSRALVIWLLDGHNGT